MRFFTKAAALGGAILLSVSAATTTASAAQAESPAAAPTTAVTQAEETWCPYRINDDGVRIRREASLDSDILGQYYLGDTTLASSSVTYGSGLAWRQTERGWVASQYLSRISGPCATV